VSSPTPKKKTRPRTTRRARTSDKSPKKDGEDDQQQVGVNEPSPAEQTPSVPQPEAVEVAPAPAPIVEDMQTPLLGAPPSRVSAYVRLFILGLSFFLAVYLGLEAASLFETFPYRLPISSLLISYGHLSDSFAAYALLGILVAEVVLVQIWAWRTRRLSAPGLADEITAIEQAKPVEPNASEQVAAPAASVPVEVTQQQPETLVLDTPQPSISDVSGPGGPMPGLDASQLAPQPEPAAPPPSLTETTQPEIPPPTTLEAAQPVVKTVEKSNESVAEIRAQAEKEQATILTQVQTPKASPKPATRATAAAVYAEPSGAESKAREGFVATYNIYPNKSDVFVGIERDLETGGFRYVVVEPKMTAIEKQVYTNLTRLLIDELEVDMEKLKSRKGAETYLAKEAKNVANKYNLKISPDSYKKIAYYFTRDYIKLGKIEVFMNDPRIEDISCDGPRVPLFIWHRDYESIPTNVVFNDEKELDTFTAKLAYVSGKHISIANPIVDANLPDGSRVQITYGREVSKRGGNFTIRKFRADPITIVDLLKYNTVSPELGAYLWYLIEKRMSILVAGGTASGKTTTLNALSMFIPPDNKIVSVEDTPELNLSHKNWIQSISRGGGVAGEITLFDLLKNALRQRPDIIIVGEVRGAEAFTLFQAIATGHGGLGTVHADSVQAAINRLTTEPMNVPKTLLGSTLDCVVMQLRIKLRDKSVRRMVNIAEIVGHETATDQIVLNNAFKWDPVTDTYIFSGRSRLFEKITKRFGTTSEQIRSDIEDRRIFLQWVMQKNIRDYRDLSQQIREFYSDPRASIDRAIRSLEGARLER
jgi:flagellar protein FlaI